MQEMQAALGPVPQRHGGGGAGQALTGQPEGGPACPSMHEANSSPRLYLLRREGGGGISAREEKSSHVQYLSVQSSLPPGPEPRRPLTLRPVLAAHKALVAFILQQLEQIGEVQLAGAVRLPPAWDLCHLHMP